MPAKKTGKAKGPTIMSEETFERMVGTKHVIIAWCLLFDPEADRNLLDAFTLDANCQSRTVGLLNAEKKARVELTSTDDLVEFMQLAHQFLADHSNDVPPSKTRTIEDVFGKATLPKKLQILLQQIKSIVGDDLFRHAGLCYSNAINANICFDEMGGLFACTSDPIYTAETAGTNGNLPTRVNHLYELRVELGDLATGFVTEVAREAASTAFKQTELSDTPKRWERFPDQIAAALHYMQSSSPQKEGRDIVLQALLPQTLAAIQNAYIENHGIITQHRRIKMISRPSDAMAEEEEEETPPPPEHNYELTAIRVYRWIPDHKTGRFRLQQEVPVAQRDALCLFFDMPSFYKDDAIGDGLSSSDDTAFFATLEHPKTDIIWVLFPALIAHPPFTGYAGETSPKHEPVYEKICSLRSGKLNYCREWCEGFSFKEETSGERRASLYELVLLGSALAVEYGLTKSQEHTRASIDECYERRRESIDCTVRHILIKSHSEAIRECESYTKRHAEDDEAMYGGYVARVGRGGVSFTNKREADAFVQAKNKEKAKREYRAAYPHNRAFHPN